MDIEHLAFFGGQFFAALDGNRMALMQYFELPSVVIFQQHRAVGPLAISELLHTIPATNHHIIDVMQSNAVNEGYLAYFFGAAQIAGSDPLEVHFVASFALDPGVLPRFFVRQFTWVSGPEVVPGPDFPLNAAGFEVVAEVEQQAPAEGEEEAVLAPAGGEEEAVLAPAGGEEEDVDNDDEDLGNDDGEGDGVVEDPPTPPPMQ